MPTYTLKDFMQTVGTGLATYTYTVPVAGLYTVSAFTTLTPPTGVSMLIAQNGTTILSTGTLNPNATEYNLEVMPKCAVGDVLTVVLSSANTPDLSVPTIKTVITLRAGS